MTFIDTNVFMYALGKPHKSQEPALAFLRRVVDESLPVCTSSEVLQELLHVYLNRGDHQLFSAALRLMDRLHIDTLPLTDIDVRRAYGIYAIHPELTARDLCHLAVAERAGATSMMTYDRNLAGASISLLTIG